MFLQQEKELSNPLLPDDRSSDGLPEEPEERGYKHQDTMNSPSMTHLSRQISSSHASLIFMV